MKIKFNERLGIPETTFEEADYADADAIKQMIEGSFVCRSCGKHNENTAWKTLKGYFASGRESIIESMKSGLKSKVKRSLTDLKAAQMQGFDEAVSIPERVVKQAEVFRELEAQKEKDNEPGYAE